MASTYTFTQKNPPVEPNQESNFSGMPVDANHVALPYGSGPQTVDISGTPVASPATVSNAAVTTLTTPLNAVQVNFLVLTNTVNVSEADATVATKYFTMPTGVLITVDVSRTSALYLKANTGAATVSFWYNVI